MIKAGILSDSHLHKPSEFFLKQCQVAFADCSVIIHAGDLTDDSILTVFSAKKIYAVHGNMCSYQVQQLLPRSKLFQLEEVTIGLYHGAWGPIHTIEERSWNLFPPVDCIIYGHSHQAVCHKTGGTLFVNPGSFQSTGRHGHPGSYATLEIDGKKLHASLHTLASEP